MAEAVIGPLVGKLLELAASEAKALAAVDDQIQVLRDNLVWLQAFVREADPKRRTNLNELVTVWVQQSRDVAFQAEDAVDRYLVHLAVARGDGVIRALIRPLAHIRTQVLVRFDLSNRVKRINKRLELLTKNRDQYKVDAGAVNSSNWRSSGAASSAAAWDKLDDSPIIREDDANQLKAMLLDGTRRQLGVVAIIGESGVGKTTLAKEMTERPEIKSQFPCRFSICLPPFLDANDILILIYGRLIKEENDMIQNETISEYIYRKLKDNAFLMVVEGAITRTNWSVILSVLPDDGVGSRVVLVARIIDGDIRTLCEDNQIMELLPLDHPNCMDLFYRRVFGSSRRGERVREQINLSGGSGGDHPKLIDYEKDIYEVSDGLPLAIVLLSGLLRTKEFPKEWYAIIKQLKDNTQGKRIGRMLSICFDDLPHQLKSCFLYIPALTENGALNAQRLVRLWIAEGFIRPDKGKLMEEVGQDYLQELIFRGLVHLESKDNCGNIKFVTIHERVYSFARFEAQEANFLLVHDSDEVLAPSGVRRLSLQNYMDRYIPITNSFPKLRSILCDFEEDNNDEGESVEDNDDEGESDRDNHRDCSIQPEKWLNCTRQSSMLKSNRLKLHTLNFLRRSPFLRVIDLRGLKTVDRLPDEIGDMVHLRYLGVKCQSVKTLPSSTRNLKYLQTLDMRNSGVQELPPALWEVSSLRHILCPELTLPDKVGNLEHLQTLQTAMCPDSAWPTDGCPLAKMTHLRYLTIQRLKESQVAAFSAAIEKLVYLTSLEMKGDALPSSILISSKHQCLRELIMHGKVDQPDNLINDKSQSQFLLPNLTKLSLTLSEVPDAFIDRLAKLRLLTELELLKGSYMGKKMNILDGGFASLKSLKLHYLNILEVRVGKMAMPKLECFDVAATRYKPKEMTVIHSHPKKIDEIKVCKNVKLNLVVEENGRV